MKSVLLLQYEEWERSTLPGSSNSNEYIPTASNSLSSGDEETLDAPMETMLELFDLGSTGSERFSESAVDDAVTD